MLLSIPLGLSTQVIGVPLAGAALINTVGREHKKRAQDIRAVISLAEGTSGPSIPPRTATGLQYIGPLQNGWARYRRSLRDQSGSRVKVARPNFIRVSLAQVHSRTVPSDRTARRSRRLCRAAALRESFQNECDTPRRI